jgi:hypothetical protein
MVVVHMSIEAMLRICLYSYLYLKLAKMLCEQEGTIVSAQNNVYTHVCKCKTDKIKERKKLKKKKSVHLEDKLKPQRKNS